MKVTMAVKISGFPLLFISMATGSLSQICARILFIFLNYTILISLMEMIYFIRVSSGGHIRHVCLVLLKLARSTEILEENYFSVQEVRIG